ncbi:MAG: hypothetical protein ACRED8_05720 [Caulobacteraceae bacterium]
MRITGVAALSLGLIILGGCVSIQPIDSRSETKVVVEKNYRLGEVKSAAVGDDVIRVKDYVLTTTTLNGFKVSETGDLVGGPVRIHLTQGDVLPSGGVVQGGNRTYHIARIRSFGIQVDDAGVIQNKVINGYGTSNGLGGPGPIVKMVYRFRVIPSTVRLMPASTTATSADGTNPNFEIVFNGIDGEASHFQYREFSANDLARPAFYQELSYPLASKEIRFKKLVIDVVNINAEQITYRVVSDQ